MAAGLGFKTFITGEVLTAGDVNGYLMQGINVFASEAARNAAITSPQEGQFAYTKDNNSLWYYSGSAWVASGATGDIEGVTVTSPLTGGGTSGTVTVGILSGTTSNLGAVQLSDSTSSTSTTLAATANAVKTTYDLANGAIPKSIATTKGDILVATGSGTLVRQGVGSNGQVLTANSAQADGVEWATPASGGGMTLLSTTTLSGVSTVISSIDQTYTNLYVMLLGAQESVTGNGMNMRWNGNTSTYIYSFYDMRNGTVSNITSANTSSIPIGPVSTQNGSGTQFFTINDYTASSNYKTAFFEGVFQYNATPNYGVYYGVGGYRTAGAISSIEFFSTGGSSVLAGTVKIYGVK